MSSISRSSVEQAVVVSNPTKSSNKRTGRIALFNEDGSTFTSGGGESYTGPKVTTSTTAPASPETNDVWIDIS